MKTINGVYTSANIFTTLNETTAIDNYAVHQIQMLCDNETAKGSIIRVMPDVHPGKVGTIGLTMTIGAKLMPNLIGIDIGCGMTLAQIKGKKIEFQKLDTIIRDNIPSGFAVRNKAHRFADEFDFTKLHCHKHIRKDKACLSLGTLGGGNHFIEADKDDDDNLYIVIHSGSRHLGKEVTEYYLNIGQNELKEKGISIPYELTYLEGATLANYLHDIQIVQNFASLNRETILDELIKGMKWKVIDSTDSEIVVTIIATGIEDNNSIPPIAKPAEFTAKPLKPITNSQNTTSPAQPANAKLMDIQIPPFLSKYSK